jgi:hypothetical protein
MIHHLLRPFACFFGVHDPIRDRLESDVPGKLGVPIFRCLHCYADLGPILQREQDRTVVELSGWRRTPTAVATTLDLRDRPVIARRK